MHRTSRPPRSAEHAPQTPVKKPSEEGFSLSSGGLRVTFLPQCAEHVRKILTIHHPSSNVHHQILKHGTLGNCDVLLSEVGEGTRKPSALVSIIENMSAGNGNRVQCRDAKNVI